MELRHARYFVAVAEKLNFRRAAVRLHLTQPSLSTQIRLLEEDVGVQLLERDSHKVELTLAGQSFLEGCRRLLQDADNCGRTARRIARRERSALDWFCSIPCPWTLAAGTAHLPATISRLATFPERNG